MWEAYTKSEPWPECCYSVFTLCVWAVSIYKLCTFCFWLSQERFWLYFFFIPPPPSLFLSIFLLQVPIPQSTGSISLVSCSTPSAVPTPQQVRLPLFDQSQWPIHFTIGINVKRAMANHSLPLKHPSRLFKFCFHSGFSPARESCGHQRWLLLTLFCICFL